RGRAVRARAVDDERRVRREGGEALLVDLAVGQADRARDVAGRVEGGGADVQQHEGARLGAQRLVHVPAVRLQPQERLEMGEGLRGLRGGEGGDGSGELPGGGHARPPRPDCARAGAGRPVSDPTMFDKILPCLPPTPAWPPSSTTAWAPSSSGSWPRPSPSPVPSCASPGTASPPARSSAGPRAPPEAFAPAPAPGSAPWPARARS